MGNRSKFGKSIFNKPPAKNKRVNGITDLLKKVMNAPHDLKSEDMWH